MQKKKKKKRTRTMIAWLYVCVFKMCKKVGIDYFTSKFLAMFEY